MAEDFEREIPFFFKDLTHEATVINGRMAGKMVVGIFDVRFFDHDMGSMRVAAENSQFLGPTKDLEGIAADDIVEIKGRRYVVAANYRDHTGMSLLDLAEMIDTAVDDGDGT